VKLISLCLRFISKLFIYKSFASLPSAIVWHLQQSRISSYLNKSPLAAIVFTFCECFHAIVIYLTCDLLSCKECFISCKVWCVWLDQWHVKESLSCIVVTFRLLQPQHTQHIALTHTMHDNSQVPNKSKIDN